MHSIILKEDMSISTSLNLRILPTCAHCRNHGFKNGLKGHKRYCRYRQCNCEHCKLTIRRKQIIKAQRKAQGQGKQQFSEQNYLFATSPHQLYPPRSESPVMQNSPSQYTTIHNNSRGLSESPLESIPSKF